MSAPASTPAQEVVAREMYEANSTMVFAIENNFFNVFKMAMTMKSANACCAHHKDSYKGPPIQKACELVRIDMIDDIIKMLKRQNRIYIEQSKGALLDASSILTAKGEINKSREILDIISPPPPLKKEPIKVPDECEEKALEGETTGQGVCIVCAHKKISTVIVPCGHMIMCVNCSRDLVIKHKKETCPTCRRKIAQIIRTF